MSEQENRTKAWIRELAKNWNPEDKNLIDVRCTGIERSIPNGSQHPDAMLALEYCKEARRFGISEKGAMFLQMAEASRKDFELYEDAVAHAPFKKGRKKGTVSSETDYLMRVVEKSPAATATEQLNIVFSNAGKEGSPYELDDPNDPEIIYIKDKNGTSGPDQDRDQTVSRWRRSAILWNMAGQLPGY